MEPNAPIGFFDSGVGGTSIWKELHHLLPHESTIYLADSKNAPYGNKPREEILALSIKNTELLLEMGSKIIVVACNTATTNSISYLRAQYDVPFIGIEPAIKPAALHSTNNKIGILATRGTLNSELFHKTAKTYASETNVVEVVGEGLVPLIEAGKIDTAEMMVLLNKYMEPMLKAGVDHIVLGCSHYPYLIPKLRGIIPEEVTIIDSGEAVAKQTKAILLAENRLRTETGDSFHRFYTNTDTSTLNILLADVEQAVSVEYREF